MKQQPLNPLDILVRLNWDEGDDLEFKSAKGGVPKSLWATYCAMANSHGGVILLGVEDDGTGSNPPRAGCPRACGQPIAPWPIPTAGLSCWEWRTTARSAASAPRPG